ncbi:MAG: DUF1080 domain-containing protein, partial [Planctomycetes bacterium]|nr:DUF1080 domain-containing protein [Planctomycetota bacterium]
KDGVLTLKAEKGYIWAPGHFRDFEFHGEYRVLHNAVLVGLAATHGQGDTAMWHDLVRGKAGEWRPMSLVSNHDGVKLTNDGRTPSGHVGKLPAASARIGLQFSAWVGGDAHIELRNLKLRPLDTKPLFTGKSLDGWKINAADPKRMASKWEITKEGELSVKNGPGDLVTEKEFDNFVLQFECKTLGKALNSGFFFRCIPGQYQNGYEAQIQNAYKDNDRTKPADFGTGAIYRRIPARKVVSNDDEWFTMTVVADGKHIATWVNGYQTVDWTDDRKENDNPRQGFRAAKGPISIQGHDPTTDILFRNIRIAELPGEHKK